ncbi:hypothetical protein QWZ06_12130 [Chryseobacterium tructae]|uniref:Bacteriocin n=1 Tax=Chryseobacterium tructae TaxID=1037380 RepID=A0ABV7XZD0_9FLAO|nr:hypothetical protein [Chryseobacterium tructae]MDN3692976.1 hypothetical protein [Chryseobacterium tructae]
MKTKKTLKFSKETVILLDNTSKKAVKGGNLNNSVAIQCEYTRPCNTRKC